MERAGDKTWRNINMSSGGDEKSNVTCEGTRGDRGRRITGESSRGTRAQEERRKRRIRQNTKGGSESKKWKTSSCAPTLLCI